MAREATPGGGGRALPPRARRLAPWAAALPVLFAACGPAPPTAGFAAEGATSGAAPLAVRFRDASQGEVERWRWDFGDGTGSTLAAPTHRYLREGRYTVTLEVTGPGGGSRHAEVDLVRVQGSARPHHVLLVLADDLSSTDLACYGTNPGLTPGLTPTLDGLAAEGVLFERAWTNPLCTPTRAQVLTGRHAFRTGLGSQVESSDHGLRAEETTLDEALARWVDGATRTAAFGKWHLEPLTTPFVCAPTDLHGFDAYDGNLWQIGDPYDWLHMDCPKPELGPPPARVPDARSSAEGSASYMPAYVFEAAAAWIAAQGDAPWFCYLAPQAPYHVAHVPPAELQDRLRPGADPCTGSGPGHARPCFEAALQAFDALLGRLLAELGPDWRETTTVVFLGDNGTPRDALDAGHRRDGKGTLYEGGVHVPLIVAGRGVHPERRGTRCSALVESTDLYRTLLALVGAEGVPGSVAEDSVDFSGWLAGGAAAPARRYLYAETFHPNAPAPPYAEHEAAARDERYKLLVDVADRAPRELYDLAADPLERDDRLAAGAAPLNAVEAEAVERLLAEVRARLDAR